jgi:hypothetical protein
MVHVSVICSVSVDSVISARVEEFVANDGLQRCHERLLPLNTALERAARVG